jgi:hypothetical protein
MRGFLFKITTFTKTIATREYKAELPLQSEMLKSVIEDCVSGFTSYSYGEDKCLFLSELTNRTFVDMEREFNCPKPENLYHEMHCGSSVTNFLTHTARANTLMLYNWLNDHRLAKHNTKCPPGGVDRHEAIAFSYIRYALTSSS